MTAEALAESSIGMSKQFEMELKRHYTHWSDRLRTEGTAHPPIQEYRFYRENIDPLPAYGFFESMLRNGRKIEIFQPLLEREEGIVFVLPPRMPEEPYAMVKLFYNTNVDVPFMEHFFGKTLPAEYAEKVITERSCIGRKKNLKLPFVLARNLNGYVYDGTMQDDRWYYPSREIFARIVAQRLDREINGMTRPLMDDLGNPIGFLLELAAQPVEVEDTFTFVDGEYVASSRLAMPLQYTQHILGCVNIGIDDLPGAKHIGQALMSDQGTFLAYTRLGSLG